MRRACSNLGCSGALRDPRGAPFFYGLHQIGKAFSLHHDVLAQFVGREIGVIGPDRRNDLLMFGKEVFMRSGTRSCRRR